MSALQFNKCGLTFLCCQVDPLFHKTSAAFDEGGTGGLLLNHLFVRDDSCELLLDSAAITMTTRDVSSEGQTTQDNSMVDLSELRGENFWLSYFMRMFIIFKRLCMLRTMLHLNSTILHL